MKKNLLFFFIVWSFNSTSQTCPELLTVMINSCPSSEGGNEWFTFKTGSNSLAVNNLTFQYATNSTFSAGLYGLTAGTATFVTQPVGVTLTGCASITVVTSGGTIPANSNVFVIPNLTTLTTINLSGICSAGAIYVLFYNTTNATGGYAAGGNFANTPGGGNPTRYFRITNTATPCNNTYPVSFYSYTNGWPSNLDGNGLKFSSPSAPTNPAYNNAGCSGGTSLPVSLISFKASYKNNISLLTWETSSEENTSHFEIERSINGTEFIVIGKVSSSGNSNTIKSYYFNDNIANKSILYYRLKSVDNTGLYAYSSIVKLKLKISGFGVNSLYPVPAKNELTVNLNSISENNLQVVITDLSGRKLQTHFLKSAPGNNQLILNIEQLAIGTYFLVLQSNGERIVEKFLKQ